jgi:CBS domain-containing protein
MSVALTREPIRELLARAPAALFGAITTEAIGRAERVVETAAPGEPLQHAVSRMWWRKMGALPVVEDGRLLGALTEDDLFHTVADRLRERGESAEDLVLWETLLAGASVRDVMTPTSDAAVVPAGTPLAQGLEATFGPTPGRRRRKSYLFVVGADGAPMRVISFRDIARYLMRLYDGELSPTLFERPEHFEAAQRMAWRVLDLSLGTLRDEESLGSAPDPLADDASGVETIERMAARARGYAVVTTRSAGRSLLRGICTRRDLLRALKNPFVRVDGLRAARIMTEPVKTVSAIDTLCGLFKMMAIEGFRHMPLVDESDEVECVISMWQGVGLLAHRQPVAP